MQKRPPGAIYRWRGPNDPRRLDKATDVASKDDAKREPLSAKELQDQQGNIIGIYRTQQPYLTVEQWLSENRKGKRKDAQKVAAPGRRVRVEAQGDVIVCPCCGITLELSKG